MATMVSSAVSPHPNSLVLDFQMSHSLPSFETRFTRFSGIIRFHKIVGICKVIYLCRIMRFCKIVHLPLKGACGSCFPENQTLLMLEGSSFRVGSDFHPGSEYDEAVATWLKTLDKLCWRHNPHHGRPSKAHQDRRQPQFTCQQSVTSGIDLQKPINSSLCLC